MDPKKKERLHRLFDGEGISVVLRHPQSRLLGEDDFVFIDKVYQGVKKELQFLNIDQARFIEEVFETFSRYKKYNKLDPFAPFDKKSRKYVQDYITRSFQEVYKKIKSGK